MTGIQDVGTIGSWTPARLSKYVQNEMNQRQRESKTSLSGDSLYAHGSLTFSSGDFQTADTILTRPSTGIVAINNDPIVTKSTAVTSVFGRKGVVVATSGDYTAAQVTNAADKSSASAQIFSGALSTSGSAHGFATNGAFVGQGDDYISVIRSAALGVLGGSVNGDSQYRVLIGSDGSYSVGSGGASQDLVLERKVNLPTGTGSFWELTSGDGFGYGTGTGGTVTQATSFTTAVTLNKPSGNITLFTSAISGGLNITFAVNNTTVGAEDVIVLSGINMNGILLSIAHVTAGRFNITWYSPSALSSATRSINFTVIKGAYT